MSTSKISPHRHADRQLPITQPQQVVLQHLLTLMPVVDPEPDHPLLQLVAARLQASPDPQLNFLLDARWLLTMCVGQLPVLMPWEFERLSRFLGMSAAELKQLIYHPGCAPGIGAFQAEFGLCIETPTEHSRQP